MPYFPVDDGFHSHRKAIKAGAHAVGLWTFCGSWSNDQGTDGFIPDYIPQRFDPEHEALTARLVEVGLFEVAEVAGEKGWMFHDWTGEGDGVRRNYTRAETLKRRRDWAERQSRRRQKGNVTRDVPRDEPRDEPRDAQETPEVVTDDSRVSLRVPVPVPSPVPKTPVVVTEEDSLEVASPPRAGAREYLPEIDPTTGPDLESEADLPARLRPVKVWCEPHGCPDDRNCTGCLQEFGDVAYRARLRAAEAAR